MNCILFLKDFDSKFLYIVYQAIVKIMCIILKSCDKNK